MDEEKYESSFTGQQIDNAVDQVINKKISADGVKFSDGETFQNKLDNGDLTGPAGKNGINGQDGRPGTDGKSAYASAMSGGYVGTESQFNQDLSKVGGKANKVAPAAAGNFAALGSGGDLQDSGKAPGKANGIATLDSSGRLPSGQLPSSTATESYVNTQINAAIGAAILKSY